MLSRFTRTIRTTGPALWQKATVAAPQQQIRFLAVPGKAAAGKKGKADGNEESKADKQETELLNFFFEKAEEASRRAVDFSEEELAEHAAIAKEYQREYNRRNARLEKDLTNKIYMQQAAIQALPFTLRELAEEIDETPPPEERPFPFWATPPIKGFNARDYMGKDDEAAAPGN